MIIKSQNNYDGRVFQINLSGESFRESANARLTPKERIIMERLVKDFIEELCVEFEYNLMPGWEEVLLSSGHVLSSDQSRELRTKEEIREELSRGGEINFFSFEKYNSWNVIDKIKIPGRSLIN